MFLLTLLVFIPDIKHFSEVLAELMRGGTLDSSSTDWDIDLSSSCEICSGKSLISGLLSSDDWDGKHLLVAPGILVKDTHYETGGTVCCCMGCMAFLPQELSRPDERSWMLELPSDNIGPLIELQRQISVRMDPFAKGWVHNCLRS